MSDRDERLKQEIIGRFMAGDSVNMLVANYTEFTSVNVLIRERITELELEIDADDINAQIAIDQIAEMSQRIKELEAENKELKEHITPVQWRYAKGLQGIESPIAEIPE